MKTLRLTAENRRTAILEAVAPLFAEHGLHGVTTLQLARSAGISEALLFRHFRNKRELFEAAQHQHPLDFAQLVPADLPPSTRRMVTTLHRLAELWTGAKNRTNTRQLGQSLLGDGTLARTYISHLNQTVLAALREDLEAAHQNGDLNGPPELPLETWLVHHLLLGIQLTSLTERPLIDYRAPRFNVVQRSVRFALRGLGVREEVIAGHYINGGITPEAGA